MKSNFEKDFEDFLQADEDTVPAKLSENILGSIKKDIGVHLGFVSLKVLALYSFSSLLFLYFCPQFGVSWGSPSVTLTHVYMYFGHNVCAALCALTLMGGNFALLALALKDSEALFIKKRSPWLPATLTLLTFALLIINGAKAHHSSFEFLIWIAMGALSSIFLFEATRKIKLKTLRVIL